MTTKERLSMTRTRSAAEPAAPVTAEPIAPEPDSAAVCRALVQRERQLCDRLDELRAQLAAAEGSITPALERAGLTGDASIADAAVAERDRLASMLRAVDAAVDGTRRERRQAIVGAWQAEADELRRQAAALRAEADARTARVIGLLDQLEAEEGVVYLPCKRPRLLFGGDVDLPAVWRGAEPRPGLLMPGKSVTLARTRSEEQRREADRLDIAADNCLKRSLKEHGSIVATSRAHLLEQLDALDPDGIAPRRDSVLAWFDSADAAAGRPEPVRVELTWSRGEIERGSRVYRPEPERTPKRRLWCRYENTGTFAGKTFVHYGGGHVSGEDRFLDWLLQVAPGVYTEADPA
jgi:hypothetical protein